MFSKIKNKIKKKIYDIEYVGALNIMASSINADAFSDIKGINTGKAVALCGAGPTLKRYQPLSGVKHVALNRALLYDKVKFDWFVADDWDGINFFIDDLISYDCIKFLGRGAVDSIRVIPESIYLKCKARKYYTDNFIFPNGFDSRFVCDIDKMVIGSQPNIALSAMQIVLFSNPSKIYLVGCDASAQGHFVDSEAITDKQNERYRKDLITAISVDSTYSKWVELKRFAEVFYPDTEIISINPVGLKGLFRDIYQDKMVEGES